MSETKLKIQSYGTQFNAPEGYLLNGKIVPSVSSTIPFTWAENDTMGIAVNYPIA